MVDNGSADDSMDHNKDNHPDFPKLIQGKIDLGFAGENNVGAVNSKGKYSDC